MRNRVLCFGDSNTWGANLQQPSLRFDESVRWPKVMQSYLGDGVEVIEEGLCGRTANMDDKGITAYNGAKHLPMCMLTHRPLDAVIIMLGTNDCKTHFGQSPEQIAAAVGELVGLVHRYSEYAEHPLPVLVISPAYIDDTKPDFARYYSEYFSAESVEKSRQLAVPMSRVARSLHCDFWDAAESGEASRDGLHISAETHRAIARRAERWVRRVVPTSASPELSRVGWQFALSGVRGG